jgi:hypothetical protein
MTTDTNWRDDAACLDADPDLFFPMGTTGDERRRPAQSGRSPSRSCLPDGAS